MGTDLDLQHGGVVGAGKGQISQERLPLYLGFFEFVHNVRRRGKALLGSLMGLLLRPSPRNAG